MVTETSYEAVRALNLLVFISIVSRGFMASGPVADIVLTDR